MRDLQDIEKDIYDYYDETGTLNDIDINLAKEYLDTISDLEGKNWQLFNDQDIKYYKYSSILSDVYKNSRLISGLNL